MGSHSGRWNSQTANSKFIIFFAGNVTQVHIRLRALHARPPRAVARQAAQGQGGRLQRHTGEYIIGISRETSSAFEFICGK